ncbi:AraC family transcriptional regulator [Erwinia sorbitola]|uniref:Helix-turn-helix domain-containing protein n=1 Tax=Erwinia sorbitola TaxID=2681984 RepID=A0A6I6EJ82_9GAMM|nr:AraC family transcriptional regulator [Erwinia sorbitola]MTD27633.1 helix-turn-helix domain-containing protein [Erwinia sorbitola]QGU86356.1 helix-turn-helix domain-containing protein [Erwinia sorbitola]
MFPFSVTQLPRLKSRQQTAIAIHEGSGYELISFDAEKLNVFAAEVYYCEPHWHSAPELVCILSGNFSVTLGHATSVVSAGSMLYIDPDEIHSLEARAPHSQLLTIQFSPHLFDETHPAPQIDDAMIARQGGHALNQQIRNSVIALLEHLVYEHSSFNRIALVYQLLGSLAAAEKDQGDRQLMTIKKKDQQLIKRAIEYINQHFDEELSLATVAESVDVSYHHFSRTFKKISGYNFKEYLTMIRINKAKRLLKDTNIPITDISYTCGFGGHKQLIFAFNKYCRMTPTAFRKNYLTAIHSTAEKPVMTDFRCLPLDQRVIDFLRNFKEMGA